MGDDTPASGGALRARRSLLRGAAASGLALAAGRARAQAPEPRRVVVNFPPGGQLDGIARLLADRAQRDGRGPVVVENRPGAGGAEQAPPRADRAARSRGVVAHGSLPPSLARRAFAARLDAETSGGQAA